MKKTKIVATIGPVSDNSQTLEELYLAGANVFRLNFSHGTYESHKKEIDNIRALEKKVGKKIPVILDTKGPEIRTGDISAPIELKDGAEIVFSVDPVISKNSEKIGVNYGDFVHDVSLGDTILVDSGVMSVRVEKILGNDVICTVLEGGMLKSRRHLNLPGKHVSLDPVTEKDWKDLEFGVEHGVDFIAQSFVRKASDIELIKDFLRKKKADHIHIIAKIETTEAVEDLENIIGVADGVMVARGDLGTELPYSTIPRIQKKIISVAEKHQKPVIVATQMLESMIENPIPTRAEVTDVSMGVVQRADACMLSGESANGEFPVKSVKAMAEILTETEKDVLSEYHIRDISCGESIVNALCKTVADLSEALDDVSAILVLTNSGWTAQFVSSFRPNVPIVAFSDKLSSVRKMNLLWGVDPYMGEFDEKNPETSVEKARSVFLESHPEYAGKKFILVSSFLVKEKFMPTVQVRMF